MLLETDMHTCFGKVTSRINQDKLFEALNTTVVYTTLDMCWKLGGVVSKLGACHPKHVTL